MVVSDSGGKKILESEFQELSYSAQMTMGKKEPRTCFFKLGEMILKDQDLRDFFLDQTHLGSGIKGLLHNK